MTIVRKVLQPVPAMGRSMVKRGWAGTAIAAVVAALVAMVVAPSAAAPAVRFDGATAVVARYRAEIPRLMAREHIPGLAVAVVDGERVVWQQGFGYTDRDRRTPITADTLFSVQSMSKIFTATAVMLAVQAGRLDLDVPITRYLPGFTVHSAFEPRPERRITLRMLLSHTAGLTHEAPVGNNYEPEPGAFEEHVRSISDTWLRFPVGTGYAYSNLGIDLAGYILEQVTGEPFPVVVRDSLLVPLHMDRSTFDRSQVHATADRAVGHAGDPVPAPVDIPMTAAGGLWSSAADLAQFLRFQLGEGTIGGHRVLAAPLMREMRTVPAPDAGAPAGYALGVARTRWRAGQYLDLFSHGGGGYGFLSDLWWLPQLQLGIAVLTNSAEHHLQGTLALGILHDLVTEPGSPYRDRLHALPTQSDVVEPDTHFVPPQDLADRISAVALPASAAQSARWAGYPEWYRTGRRGAMSPSTPPSRFHVESGVPYFDAAEDGTPVRHRLTEFRPGLFLADNGEFLDLRGPPVRWRGLNLNPVGNGPRPLQWTLLVVVAVVAAGWLVAAGATVVRQRARARPAASLGDRLGRRAAAVVAALGALAALATVAAIGRLPGLVDVGFLGWMAWPLPLRLAFRLPLAVAVLAVSLAVLVTAGVLRHWWVTRVRPLDAALAGALIALAAQLASWQLVA
ncbi:beta-lactamase family protein [Actinoplanes sp. KI2]|uniref:serine hydrolase domain-containing protein n=1 Tax=Actinoplanes sp. KI2 TaxID=2983315 RepID=UPI0021D60E9C|nr:serine hydrolase domain-containing protein [Actinoplanes sp. KI2]MCU7731012.1 beta-lactamase family protein [Actinoplanes sp. KI2]